MDGTSYITLFSSIQGSLGSLAVDRVQRRVYWANNDLKRIERGDFDGGSIQTVLHDRPHNIFLGISRLHPLVKFFVVNIFIVNICEFRTNVANSEKGAFSYKMTDSQQKQCLRNFIF